MRLLVVWMVQCPTAPDKSGRPIRIETFQVETFDQPPDVRAIILVRFIAKMSSKLTLR